MAYASMNLVCSFNLHCVEKGKTKPNCFSLLYRTNNLGTSILSWQIVW